MRRKKISIILILFFCISAVILNVIYYWQRDNNLKSVSHKISDNQDIERAEKKIISQNQQLSVKDLLNFSTQKKKLLQAREEVSLIAVGDISYSRGVEKTIKKQKNINYPFLKIGDFLRSSDLVFGNLETPITAGREISDREMIFRSNPGTEQALKNAGFSILSLANNHTPNFGESGLKDTFNYLKKADLDYIGAGENEIEANRPIYREKKGIKFAFLAYNDLDVVPASYEASDQRAGTAFMNNEKMIKAVKAAKEKVDFVIVSMHAGIEYTGKPNSSQTNFAHAAIDAGADLVIGHHPHVVQTMEEYKGKYIFYSLGNFVFDQAWSLDTKEGLAIKVYFTKSGISKISLLPITMKNFAQPSLAVDLEAEKILQRLNFPLTDQVAYSWNSDTKNFNKTFRAVVYNQTPKNKPIAFRKEQADLDNNSESETYVLENGRLTITEKAKLIWQSPSDWWIDNYILADSNNDGVIDINLSVWKIGNFGNSKPFWVKEDDLSLKNHLFIFDLRSGIIKPIWQSSNLETQSCEFTFADVDNDGKKDLLVIEGDYSQAPEFQGDYIALWRWNGWGFSNDWRSEKGNYSGLNIEKNNTGDNIIIDSLN